MNRTEAHALRNILQALVSFVELGYKDRALDCCRDLNMCIGNQRTPWPPTEDKFQLDGGIELRVEVYPDKIVFLELKDDVFRTQLSLTCPIARQVGELLVSYCDMTELKSYQNRLLRMKDAS